MRHRHRFPALALIKAALVVGLRAFITRSVSEDAFEIAVSLLTLRVMTATPLQRWRFGL